MNTENKTTTGAEGRELFLTRVINAPPHQLFQAWTDPELLKQWFCPQPWTVSRADMDVRPGGSSCIVMRSPEGQEFPNPGVFLDVARDQRIVMTNAFAKAWEPVELSGDPNDCNNLLMVVEVTFEDLGGKTRYSARVRHWTVEGREAHEKMGFHEGWAICTEQLAKLVEKQ